MVSGFYVDDWNGVCMFLMMEDTWPCRAVQRQRGRVRMVLKGRPAVRSVCEHEQFMLQNHLQCIHTEEEHREGKVSVDETASVFS